MALITRVYLLDDLDGSQVDVSTVRFALDGTDFEIDLSATNAERLRGKLAKFVDAATPVKAAKAPSRRAVKPAAPAAASPDRTHEIREWARSNGFDVPARGRIAKSIKDAFEAAH